MSRRKRAEWVERKKDDAYLVWIDKPKPGEAVQVAEKIWSMYFDDYNLTFKEIESILLCSRDWVTANIRDHVKHIFLGYPMRKFMMSIDYGKETEFILLKDYYYFSRSDFYRWLRENTIAEKRTITIDLCKYSNDARKLRNMNRELEMELSKCKSIQDMGVVYRKYDKMFHTNLTRKGQILYDARTYPSERTADPVEIKLELPSKFISIRDLRARYRNNERAYRRLYELGAIKYTIAGSLVRFDDRFEDKQPINLGFPVLIEYSKYIQQEEELDFL